MTPRKPRARSVQRYVRFVLTLLLIDDDVLESVRCIAKDEGRSAGEVMSRLVRLAFAPNLEANVRQRVVFQGRRRRSACSW